MHTLIFVNDLWKINTLYSIYIEYTCHQWKWLINRKYITAVPTGFFGHFLNNITYLITKASTKLWRLTVFSFQHENNPKHTSKTNRSPDLNPKICEVPWKVRRQEMSRSAFVKNKRQNTLSQDVPNWLNQQRLKAVIKLNKGVPSKY